MSEDIVKNHGGKREGSGRKATGREKKVFYVTNEEGAWLKEKLEKKRKLDDILKELRDNLLGNQVKLKELDDILVKKGFKSNKSDTIEDTIDFVNQKEWQWWLDGNEYDNEPCDFTFSFNVLKLQNDIWETELEITEIEK